MPILQTTECQAVSDLSDEVDNKLSAFNALLEVAIHSCRYGFNRVVAIATSIVLGPPRKNHSGQHACHEKNTTGAAHA